VNSLQRISIPFIASWSAHWGQRDVVRREADFLRVRLSLFVFRVDDLKYHEHVKNISRTSHEQYRLASFRLIFLLILP